mmetsp:Transcript_28202/g.58788  ORF Transcript_28202/g.58788 Transcript_28202/m.58788 type:complete len:209 (-) Transcript_28202:282-908(-)
MNKNYTTNDKLFFALPKIKSILWTCSHSLTKGTETQSQTIPYLAIIANISVVVIITPMNLRPAPLVPDSFATDGTSFLAKRNSTRNGALSPSTIGTRRRRCLPLFSSSPPSSSLPLPVVLPPSNGGVYTAAAVPVAPITSPPASSNTCAVNSVDTNSTRKLNPSTILSSTSVTKLGPPSPSMGVAITRPLESCNSNEVTVTSTLGLDE